MVATVRNLTSASATSEYFRSEGAYYVGSDGAVESLRAKREEHREASAWHGRGAAALGLKAGARVAARAFEKLLRGFVLGTGLRLGADTARPARASSGFRSDFFGAEVGIAGGSAADGASSSGRPLGGPGA